MIVEWDSFWRRVERRGPDECWPWLGPLDTRGYGHTAYDGRNYRAHRLAYISVNGPIPTHDNNSSVMHSCDNRPCCNPAHLSLGTHAANMADMKAKGRRKNINFAEANGRAKLTSDQVAAIRSDVRGKIKLSREYGVSPAQIQRIRAGKQWNVPHSDHGNNRGCGTLHT